MIELQESNFNTLLTLKIRVGETSSAHPCCQRTGTSKTVDWCVVCRKEKNLRGLGAGAPVFRRRVAALLLAQAQRSLFRNQVVGSISASIEIRS